MAEAEKENILALDIAHQSIKVVAASRADGKTIFKRAGIVSTFRKGAPASLADILYLMKETTGPWNFQPNSVRVSLSGNAITVRFIAVAKTTKEQLLAEIKADSGKFIPVPLTDTFIDCDVFAPPAGAKTAEKYTAVIAAVKRESVGDLAKLLNGMNVSPMLLDVNSLALLNAFEVYGDMVKVHGYKNYAIVDMGSHSSNCAIVREGIPTFMRDLPIGGTKITDAVAAAMSLESDKAEMSKRTPDPAILEPMKNVFKPLADEMLNSFHFFETEQGATVDGVYVTGGAALTPGLLEHVQQQLELPVHIWNPFESAQMQLDETMTNQKPHGVRYAVCCGLIARADKLV